MRRSRRGNIEYHNEVSIMTDQTNPWQEIHEFVEQIYAELDAELRKRSSSAAEVDRAISDHANRRANEIVNVLNEEENLMAQNILSYALFTIVANELKEDGRDPDEAPREMVHRLA